MSNPPRPSEIYVNTTREQMLQGAHDDGYRVVAFRIPKVGERYIIPAPTACRYIGTLEARANVWAHASDPWEWRLIVEKI